MRHSCESVRKAIERVFGILKKRFRILKIPLPCYNLLQVVDIVHSCCILHNMLLEDKDRINLGLVRTQRCDGYADTRHILAHHFAIVDNIRFSGKSTDKAMWLKPAAVTRPCPTR